MSPTYLVAPERYVTDRFVIRCYRPGDGPMMAEAVNDSYEHLKTFMPWAKPDQSDEESEQLARSFRGRYLLAEDFVLGIFSPDEYQVLGGTGYHLREGGLDNRSAEIGMWIRATQAGQGLGTEVLRALIRWGFSAWPWERLSWRCSSLNHASRRTAEKSGMTLEGTLRARTRLPDGSREDMLTFAILRSEWVE